MQVLFAASEAAPFVKTGGLADVIGALPPALQRSGRAECFVVLPLYACIDTIEHDIRPTGIGADVQVNGSTEWANLWHCEREVPFFFIDNPKYFNRPHPYCENGYEYQDSAERFIFFSRAILELCKKLDFHPHILHCNDWHTSLVPIFLRTDSSAFDGAEPVASILTIHNAGYQGRFGLDKFPLTGLPWELLDPQTGMRDGDGINFLKGGALFSDAISVVSPRYSEEIKYFPMGGGLEEVFRRRANDLFGILNGVDQREWSPSSDPFIAQCFHASDLSGKAVCKRDVQAHLGLPVREDVPLIAAIMRLSEQKGIHLLDPLIDALPTADVQFVLVGSGHPAVEERARTLAEAYPRHFAALVGSHISYEPSVVHRVTAGADIIVMPSLYEPCGLNQMFSLLYGTVPVVRATGGLDDTIEEYNPSSGTGNGFRFYDATPHAFGEAVGRALYYFREQKADWERIMRNGMRSDFSWDAVAGHYLALYEYTISRKRQFAAAEW